MAAPTVAAYQESFTDTAALATASITWLAGDVIVVVGGTEDSGEPIATPTATGLTFSAITGALCNASSDTYANAWVATPGAGGSSAVSASVTGSFPGAGIGAWVWRGSSGIGNVGASGSTANNNLTQSLVRSGTNSCVCGGVFDWGAGAVTGYGWTPTVGNDRHHAVDGTKYTAYLADWGDQGTAGTTSYGLTGITSGPFARVFVEILPAGGTDATVTFPQSILIHP